MSMLMTAIRCFHCPLCWYGIGIFQRARWVAQPGRLHRPQRVHHTSPRAIPGVHVGVSRHIPDPRSRLSRRPRRRRAAGPRAARRAGPPRDRRARVGSGWPGRDPERAARGRQSRTSERDPEGDETGVTAGD